MLLSLQCADMFFFFERKLTCLLHLQSHIAKRSDMAVMSTDGPLGAYVNPHGCVHETITVSNATGLALTGSPSTVHSWFPGYEPVSGVRCSFVVSYLYTFDSEN